MWHSVCLFHTLVFHVGPQELQQFRRVLQAQLLFGLREHHLWISLWERPAHSSFSRAQRVTCCCLLLHLYLAAGAVWYGAVGRKGSRYLTWTSKGMKNILSLYYKYSGADRSTGTGITPCRIKQFMFFTKIQKSVISSSYLALTLRKKYEIFMKFLLQYVHTIISILCVHIVTKIWNIFFWFDINENGCLYVLTVVARSLHICWWIQRPFWLEWRWRLWCSLYKPFSGCCFKTPKARCVQICSNLTTPYK